MILYLMNGHLVDMKDLTIVGERKRHTASPGHPGVYLQAWEHARDLLSVLRYQAGGSVVIGFTQYS